MPLSVRLNCTCCAASFAIPPGPNSGCWALGTRGASFREVALLDQALDDLVEQLGELALQVGVPLGVARGLATQRLEHLGSQLARVHERLEDRLAQRVERTVGLLIAELAPEGVGVRASGEARLQQEVGELVEQALEVDRVDQLGQVAAVGRVPHRRSTPNIGAPRAFPQ